jgi:hypothetical protein
MNSPLMFSTSTLKCVGPVVVREGTLLAGEGLGNDHFLVEAVNYIGARVVGMTLTFDRVRNEH